MRPEWPLVKPSKICGILDRTCCFCSSGSDVEFLANDAGDSSVEDKAWGDASRLWVHDALDDPGPNRRLTQRRGRSSIFGAALWSVPARALHHNDAR